MILYIKLSFNLIEPLTYRFKVCIQVQLLFFCKMNQKYGSYWYESVKTTARGDKLTAFPSGQISSSTSRLIEAEIHKKSFFEAEGEIYLAPNYGIQL